MAFNSKAIHEADPAARVGGPRRTSFQVSNSTVWNRPDLEYFARDVIDLHPVAHADAVAAEQYEPARRSQR